MKYIIIIVFCLIGLQSFSFQNTDSLAYNLQRDKINDMLDLRSQKFGEFEQSLMSKSGIFGFKTKNDMQKSLSILSEIVKTDNDILKETKTLLDFKNYQQEQASNQSKLSEEKSLAYMRTLNKLQADNEKMRAELAEAKKSQKFFQLIAFGLGLAIASILLFIFRKISSK